MIENVAALYRVAGGDAELALFQDMPHGIAGWPEPQVARMVERMKTFIARQVAAPVAAS
jgi:dipeptidyl aminopeptidase/acylaminoacyl peptidase